MKPVTVGIFALLCLVGVSLAQYGNFGRQGGRSGGYSWLVLIGAFFILLLIFNRGTQFSGVTRLVYGNLSGTPVLTTG